MEIWFDRAKSTYKLTCRLLIHRH